jgi:hypothetical protein
MASGWVFVRKPGGDLPAGLGVGSGTLLDIEGEISRVATSVVLVPFPRPVSAHN